MDIKKIQELIKLLNKTNLSEIRIEEGDFKITLRTKDYTPPGKSEKVISVAPPSGQSNTEVKTVPTESPKPATPTEDENKFITIKSPMIGTFYRASSPDKEPFIKPGDLIKPGTVVCVIEAMKLFNEIESEISGKIVKVLVDNATPVEYDQPLFLVEPN